MSNSIYCSHQLHPVHVRVSIEQLIVSQFMQSELIASHHPISLCSGEETSFTWYSWAWVSVYSIRKTQPNVSAFFSSICVVESKRKLIRKRDDVHASHIGMTWVNETDNNDLSNSIEKSPHISQLTSCKCHGGAMFVELGDERKNPWNCRLGNIGSCINSFHSMLMSVKCIAFAKDFDKLILRYN